MKRGNKRKGLARNTRKKGNTEKKKNTKTEVRNFEKRRKK